VYAIHVLSGQFLQHEAGSKRWFVLPNKVALLKVKQALWDKYTPFWAKNISVEQHTLESIMKTVPKEISSFFCVGFV
jgi:hypothetical protein